MIENMIKERNLEKNLKLMGRVNNMNEKYKDYFPIEVKQKK